MTIPDGYMQDSAGRLVPRDKVKPEHLLQDDLVCRLFAQAAERREQLRAFREVCFSEIRSFLALLAENYDTAMGGAKGNLTLPSYDGTKRITVAIGDSISFGPELQVAKTLIDSCLTRWTEGGNANVRAVVLDAFEVGKEGKIRTDKILGLRRLAIEDDEWKRAMGAISDSIRIDTTKAYIRFHERQRAEDAFSQVPLDIARA
ncbi:DUF3164 family protein [Gluconacetobacter sp. 1b LMG 1731]|uniref:DUF3164 family protein n=1 Tax=Gluconacetobacter dulcium TaxID=2729096 RepID=A0A7W4IK32_9PROT|nr:DUF3164 family protein [Gluconacetobacter dulcium]MBB2164326.1 DUF3164 family protein [Gluconacetobacter dulcium]MBB2193604.1 DUF3164 family protein [Gluconacetobacter dulcium]